MHFVVLRLSKSGMSYGQTAFIFEQSAFLILLPREEI